MHLGHDAVPLTLAADPRRAGVANGPAPAERFTLSNFSEETTMQHGLSRRTLMKIALLQSALVPAFALFAKGSQAAVLTPLDEHDPAARAVNFVNDGSKLNAGTPKASHLCAICVRYQGKRTDATAGCNIFAGRSVPAGGWCKVWTQRSD
jgi:hypothetical protein